MPKLFVIMPFGNKTTEAEGAVDYDRIYSEIIRPAGDDAGLEVLKMDLVTTPGRISDQFLSELYLADVALADVTLPNANVYYELGIRHTMGSGPTILIARKDVDLPFDFRDQRVLLYMAETKPQIAQARQAIASALRGVAREPGQNPVQQFLHSIGASTSPVGDNAAFEQDLRGRIQRARNANQLIAIWKWAQQFDRLPALTLAALADRLADEKEWALAAEVIAQALANRPNDFELHRSLGFYLRKTGRYEEAERAFKTAIGLNPSDPETLGMLGGLLKRQERFAEAAEHYGRGAAIAPGNLYLRNNSIAMVLLAAPLESSKARDMYAALLKDLLALPPDQKDEWTECMTGEAHFVLGQDAEARRHLGTAARLATSPNVLLSPADQFDLLAKHGFRPRDSADMASWLRQLHRQLTEPEPAPQRSEEPVRVVEPAQPAAAPPPPCPLIIHLSDIHFGSRPGPDGKPVRMHRFFDGDYSDKLVTHLLNEFTSQKRHFELAGRQVYLIVSGDLTYTATKEEFRESFEFLEELCRGLNVPKERVTLCPGNHDVNWAESRIDKSKRFDPYLSFVRKFYGDGLFRRLYPFVTWDFQFDTDRPHPGDMVSVQLFEPQGLLILSLNSCVYETEEHHYGFVGGKQLQKAEKLLDSTMGKGKLLRVAVVHHHLHSYPEPVQITAAGDHWQDLSTIRDSALLEKYLLKNNFDMVFHGHKHKPQLRETVVRDPGFTDSVRPLILFGGGSCGVDSLELEHSIPNQYQIVEILNSPRLKAADFLRVEWREIAVAPGAEWITAKTWTLQG